MSDRETTHNLMYLVIGLIFGYALTVLWQEKHPVKPKEVAVVQKQIAHRNDTVRIIDSATAMKKLRVHKLSKRQLREEFDSAFAVTSPDTVIKHDTMLVAVEQVEKCLELQAQHEGDSAKLMLDNRTLDAVDSTVQQLNVVQETNWKHVGVGALIGALATALFILGTN